MITKTIAGIKYNYPQVTLLHTTPLVNSELAGRVCYDSFSNSEHEQVRTFDMKPIDDVEHSDLLDELCHVYFHMSVAEHINLTYIIKDTSRAVLVEESRHRIQAISVRSTRYTMQDILHAFNACSVSLLDNAKNDFREILKPMNMFVVNDEAESIEIDAIYDKLNYQLLSLGRDEFVNISMGKAAKEVFAERWKTTKQTPQDVFEQLKDCKAKRNVGDNFKWVVTDMWKVDMVVTFNLRSLKNFFSLRDNSAAYFGIQWLAQAMKEVTPSKYLNLISKRAKNADR